ncbi:MAG TPA: nuclear transport factor 2 family protein [Solirubrobacteraceae bacterium]
MSTTTAFDVDAFVKSIEGRDAETQIGLYAEDAVVTTVDHEHPPSKPDVVRGREQVAAQLRDVLGRDMTHEVSDVVLTGDALAYRIDCRYPDGTRVACHAIARIRDGKIVSQHGVQAWDH